MHDLLIVGFWLSVGLIAYSFAGYPILLFVLTIGRRRQSPDGMAFIPNVAVLVAAHNEEEVIRQKIENLLAQGYPLDRLSILIGSDNSSDQTVAIARRFESTAPVRVFEFKERRGKLGTMNALVREAKGDILVLTDANCMFSDGAISALIAAFADPNVGCVGGEKTIVQSGMANTSKGEGIYWKIEAYLRRKESLLGSCAGVDGAIYALRRELYPFPPEKLLLMDDFIISLLAVKQGFRCIYEPEAKAFEESSDNLNAEFKRKGRILAGAVNALALAPILLVPFRSPVALQLWSHKVLRWLGGPLLLLALACNIVLLGVPLYRLILLPHLCFYGAGLAGLILAGRGMKPKIFYVPFYFLFMNFSQVFGIRELILRGKLGFWERQGR